MNAPWNPQPSTPTKNWPSERLGNLAEHRLGKMLDKAKNTGAPRKYLRNPNIRWFEVDLSDLQEILVEDKDVSKYELLRGDILICEGGEAGRAAIWEDERVDVIFQKACHRVRVGPNLDARFLVHRLYYDYFNGGLEDYYTGATIKHFTGQDLAQYEFPLPPLDEQRRIAAILDKADALRRKRKRALDLLDRLTQSIFLEMFGEPVCNEKGLPTTTLGSLGVEMLYGPRFYNETYSEDGTRIVRITDLEVSGELNFDDMPRLSVSEEDLNTHQSKPGEILFARTGATVGKMALVMPGDPETIPGAYFIRLRFSSDIDPCFAFHTLRQRSIQKIIAEQSRQSAQQNFSGPGLRRLPFFLPSKNDQARFSEHAGGIAKRKAFYRACIFRFDHMFASLQHRAFSGQL